MSAGENVCCCLVSVHMAVNTKLDVKPVDNVVATVYGQKDSGLFVTCPLTTLLH